jgi:hypothetical protein
VYILVSVHIAVMIVTNLSSDCNIRRYISVYIWGIVHIAVMFVTKLSRYWNSRSHINVYGGTSISL